MSLLLLLNPTKSITTITPVDPGPQLGPGMIGGVDGSNLVPLKPKPKLKRKKKQVVDELSEELPQFTEYIREVADIAPQLLSVLMPEAINLEGLAERLDFLRNMEQVGLKLLQQETDNYLQRLEIEQRVAMELELAAIRDRVDDAENEELIVLLLHKLH